MHKYLFNPYHKLTKETRFPWTLEIGFLNGEVRILEIEDYVRTSDGFVLHLIGADGTHYNHNTIISMKKVD